MNLALVAYIFFSKTPQQLNESSALKQETPKRIIIDKLHFDKEQIAKYDVLIEQHRIIIKSLKDSINIDKNELYSTLTSDNFGGNDSLNDSLIERLGVLQREVELTNYNHFTAIRSLCEPEQIEYFNQLTKELAGFFAAWKNSVPKPRD